MSCVNDCVGRTQIEALERLSLIMLMCVFLILIVIVTQRFDNDGANNNFLIY